MADTYKTVKVHKDKCARAKKKGMTFNEYVDHLEAMVDADRTTEQENQLERLKALEGTVGSLAEALKSVRYLTDTQSRKIDEQTALIAQQSDMLTKLLNAYGADVAFIQALKKEITT
jgi:KaiC/GvpD/RAD55 family RecA-like ATPase